jgi:hypothetical protein
MTPEDIITLGQSLYGEPWLEKMACDLEYSASQLWRLAYAGAPVTKRMQSAENWDNSGLIRAKSWNRWKSVNTPLART